MRPFSRTLLLAVIAIAVSGCAGGGTSQAPSSVTADVLPQSLGPAVASSANVNDDGVPAHALFPRAMARKAQYGQLFYHNGVVQKKPAIYVVYWGFTGAASDPYGVAPYLTAFLKGLSGTSYFDIVTQYYSKKRGDITDPSGEFAGEWFDTSPVPNEPSGRAIAAEAVKAAEHFGYNWDASYIVQLPHGSIKKLGYCAYHSVVTSAIGNVHYTDLPYQPDFPACGVDSVNGGPQGELDSTSETAAHEVAETQTDPDTVSGWFDRYGNEIGDYCSYINLQNITLATGTFAIQPLWSDAAHYCAVSYP